MTQERQSRRETKKKRAMTMKEKRHAKKSKREENTAPGPANRA
jgi:hypothetical protein